MISIGFAVLNTISEKKCSRIDRLSEKIVFLVRWAGYNALTVATGTLTIACIACYNSERIDFSKLYLIVATFVVVWLYLGIARTAAVLMDCCILGHQKI